MLHFGFKNFLECEKPISVVQAKFKFGHYQTMYMYMGGVQDNLIRGGLTHKNTGKFTGDSAPNK